MVDIIFVNPPLTLKERFGKFAPAGNLMPPLGLCYLAASCRSEGLETSIIDAPAEQLNVEQTIYRIIKQAPSFVGITATTLSIANAAKLAEAIKREASKIVIIIGGPHVSSVPEITLTKYPCFDFGVVGEGERTIIDLINILKNRDNIESVDGIIYNNGNRLHRNTIRENEKDLDTLPMPAWDLLPNYPHPYKPLGIAMGNRLQGSIITSRGCPFDCSYCPKSVFGRIVRKHSIDRVMEMILEQYNKYNVRDLEIYDDLLILSKDRITELCNRLISERLDLIWSCNSTIGAVDKETLILMKKAGCWKIGFGIESGDPIILNLMNKHLDLNKAKKVLQASKEAGLVNRGYFIIGFPMETKDSIRKTIEFAKKADLDIVQFNSFTPLPGSPIYKNIHQYGQFEDNWEEMNFVNSVFIPHGFSRDQLELAIRMAYKEFYMRYKIILFFLIRIKGYKMMMVLIKNSLNFLKIIYIKERNLIL